MRLAQTQNAKNSRPTAKLKVKEIKVDEASKSRTKKSCVKLKALGKTPRPASSVVRPFLGRIVRILRLLAGVRLGTR